ncbi:MAG: amidohydrolase family protein [Alphaproteobacteria bacterium]|nr:amidohydrolase family protein [Alphaproteobacteria bacterium]
MDYDLIIRGGNIADGSGDVIFEGDVAVKDGLIAAVGQVSGKATEEVDAKGMLVTPGFVDIHTHYDGQATWEERLVPSSWHGVTTTAFGNCGVGFAPVREQDRQSLIDLMEGVEEIPGSALHEGLKWDWESFPEYLDALDRRKHDMDLCAQLPHAALRVFVMGERALHLEDANEDDISAMRVLAAEAMKAGGFGFTTSRSLNHMTVQGDPTPTLKAREEELTGIAMGLKDAGTGVIQMIGEFSPDDRHEEIAMWQRIMRQSGRPLSITVTQRHRDPDGWRDILHGIDAASEEGLEMRAQIAPRSIGSMYGLSLSQHAFYLHPSYKEIADKPLEEKVAIMRDPSFREKLLSEKPIHRSQRVIDRCTNFDFTFRLGDPPDYEPSKDRSIRNLAKQAGRDPLDLTYDLLLEKEGKAFLFSPNTNYAGYNLDVCSEMIRHPRSCLGLSDGGAHVGHISDSGYPTFVLTHWGRDRETGRIDLPWLVRWITSATAEAIGLHDRGRLAPGYRADINIIDYDKLGQSYPYLTYDLPMGGRRFMQKGEGYKATYLGGVATYLDGESTGALPGKLVRGPQVGPALATAAE